MKKLLLGVAAGIVGTVLATTASAQSGVTFDVLFNDTILAQGTNGWTLGDRFVLNDQLSRGGEVVGRIGGVCTIIDVEGFALCNMTFVLPDGEISGQFLNSPPPEKTFAITGGTAAYLGRPGYGILIENGDGTGTVTFHFAE